MTMPIQTDKDNVRRLNAYLELEMLDRPMLLPRFWWMVFAFAVPFLLAGSSTLLFALWQHTTQQSEIAIIRFGSLAGLSGLAIAGYFYWMLVGRARD